MITFGPLGDLMTQIARATCELIIGIFALIPV